MNAYKTPVATRLIASVIAVGVTLSLLSAVVSPAMQPQIDGSVSLAHATVNAPQVTAIVMIARADVSGAR